MNQQLLSNDLNFRIGQTIFKSLRKLHDLKFRHGDIKIENLLYDSESNIKICDFGSVTKEFIDFSKIKEDQFYIYDEFFEKNTTQMYRAPEMCDFYQKHIGK